MHKLTKILLSLGILLFVGFLIGMIFIPSYISLVASCDQEKFNDTFSDNYAIAGTTSFIPEGNGTITVNLFSPDAQTIKHELIHVNQIRRGDPSKLSCNRPIAKYFTEVEAYLFSYLPDSLFNLIYDRNDVVIQ